ncbi:hypothetical protein ACFSOZ_30730 [Mesorhizobium newzealandense]|uniref:Uncharacterized protein n=1 Tax=Mesorhizobium newzealandense TaxID=1300302 RepID=A0ABW4UI69_9HYPH
MSVLDQRLLVGRKLAELPHSHAAAESEYGDAAVCARDAPIPVVLAKTPSSFARLGESAYIP